MEIIMNQTELTTNISPLYSTTGFTSPAAPVITLTNMSSDVSNADPASVVCKEHYPIPSFFEYRIKPREYDFL